MRQTALICLLAYIGSFVPAQAAHLGPLDRIFTRLGAADDLAAGRSTFMVEMTETANILHHATEQSLVLLDEIGRGTSTFDGLALAWACASHLAQVRAYTLFATHYFELTQLAEQIENIENMHLEAVEHGDDIVFLYQLKSGPASKSYGLQVARLAGVPSDVIGLAKAKLANLEQHQTSHTPNNKAREIQQPITTIEPHPAIDLLNRVKPDSLSPKQALEIIYELKATVDETCPA